MLNWVRFHQKELRADIYQGLRDAAAGDRDENFNLAEHGQRIILPSTHIGSERNMLQLYQDSMAICRAFRKPDIFLTMTSNPNWVEVQEAVLKEPTVNGQIQKAVDRPDIVVRVFEEKKKSTAERNQRWIIWQDSSYGTYNRISEKRPTSYASFNLFGSG